MLGVSAAARELLDAEAYCRHLVAEGSVFAFLADHRREVFPDGLFDDLFAVSGRPSVPVDVGASVIVLQALQGLSDRDAVAALRCDLRWKVACGLAIDDAAFHPTTLTYWRRRLRDSEHPNRIFEAVRQVVAGTGVLSGKAMRALDSTVLDDAVATQDTVTQLIAAVRRVRRQVPGAAEVVAEHCSAHDYHDPGKPAIAWNDPEARQQLVDGLVGDAHRLLGHLPDQELGPDAAEAVALLALVAGQDVEPAEGSDGTDGRWRIARRVAPDRVVSVVDADARHAHKTVARRQDGFTAHVSVEPETGLYVGGELTKSCGADNSDAAAGLRLLEQETGPVEVLGDSAYGTGKMLAALAEAGHVAVVKPWPVRPVAPGGFTIDDFTVDEPAATVTCPNGITRPMSAARTVFFGAACAACPLRERCTTSARGKKLKVHEHDAIQRQHRQRAADPAFQSAYRQHRPMVERGISWLVAGGNRRLRYRGVRRNDQWLRHRLAGLNLRRLATLGLTRTGGAWVLA